MERQPSSCAERDRLWEALKAKERDLFALEEHLGSMLVSPDRNVVRKVKNELEGARRRKTHALRELMDHEQKHRCHY